MRDLSAYQIILLNPGPALPAITPAIGTHDRQDCKDGFYNYILISRSGVASTWDMTASTVENGSTMLFNIILQVGRCQ